MKNTNKALLIWTAMALAVSLGCSEDGGDADAGSGGFGGNDELISETGGATGLDGFSPSGAAGASGEDGTGGSTGTPTTSGGEIREGICYPPEPAPTRDDLGDAVEVLDSSGDMITGPATYPGGVIYDVEGEGLYNIPAGSSTPELIVATQGRRYYPWIMGDYLYFSVLRYMTVDEPSPVSRLPLSDLSATPERVLDDKPDSSTLSESYLYVYDRDATRNIARQPIGGGEVEMFARSTFGIVRVFGDGYVYFVRPTPYDDQIWRKPEAGGEEEMVVDVTLSIQRYEVTDKGVFVSSHSSLSFTPFGDPGTRTVYRKNSVSSGFVSDHYVVGVTDTRLYWVQVEFFDGTIGWTALDHSDCDYVIAAGSDYDNAALGPDGIYVTTSGVNDEIYRIGF